MSRPWRCSNGWASACDPHRARLNPAARRLRIGKAPTSALHPIQENPMRHTSLNKARSGLLVLAALCAAGSGIASSHREGPFIASAPKVDASDFYMFRSYEGVAADGSGGRSDYVTLIANYQPL